MGEIVDWPWLLSICGVLIGTIMGYIARRNHFCTLSALERHWFAGDSTGLRSWILAAITALALTQILVVLGIFSPAASFYITEPLPIAGSVLGGVMFGLGMALVGTCGFGAIVRLGGGSMRALVVLTGIGLAALAAQRGVTGHVRAALLDPLSLDLTSRGGQSLGTLLSNATGMRLGMPLALLITCVSLVWIFRDSKFRRARGKIIAGFSIGLCIAAGWLVTYQVHLVSFFPQQVEAGSFVMPVGDTILQLITVTGSPPDYGVGLMVGVFIGAAVAAWRARDIRWEACDDARELSRHLAGAFLMGTGGVFALGCTIGQGISAVSVMAVSAPIVILSIAFGARIGLGMMIEGSAFGFLTAPKAQERI